MEEEYEVWMEGFSATGDYSPARFLGVYKGETFKKACEKAVIQKGWDMESYDKETNSFWACRFFDNELDARKSFG